MVITDFSKVDFGESGWSSDGWYHVYELAPGIPRAYKFLLPRFADHVEGEHPLDRLRVLDEYVTGISFIASFASIHIAPEHRSSGCWGSRVLIGENIQALHHGLMCVVETEGAKRLKMSSHPVWSMEPTLKPFPLGLTPLGADKVLMDSVAAITFHPVYFLSQYDEEMLKM